MLLNSRLLVFYLIFLFNLNGTFGRVVQPRGPFNQTCLNYIRNYTPEGNYTEKCNFMKCFEERFPCGPNYWIISWGYKYCLKYADEEFRSKITSKGIEMFNGMDACLLKRLEPYYVSNEALNCQNLYTMGFKIQTQCYMNMGETFCEGFRENGYAMMRTTDILDIFKGYSIMRKATSICKPAISFTNLIFS
jgi:hypothetical protein